MAENLNNKPKYHVPALEKGLDILEFLSEVNTPQSQAEIARALGRSTSEIFRMLDCLEMRNYIIRDAHSNQYALSLRLYEMAHNHSPIDQLLGVAQAPMRKIAESTRESVHLSILEGDEVLILAQEESPEPIRLSLSIGSKQAILKTASGRLLLAHWDEAKQQSFLASDPHFQGMSAAEQKILLNSLRQAREDGFVIADSQFTRGVRDISVLIGNPKLALMAALATPVLMHLDKEPDTTMILTALQEQAERITRKVGLNSENTVPVF